MSSTNVALVFQTDKLSCTDTLKSGVVPAIGPANVEHLKKNIDPAITTSVELMGAFLRLNCDKVKFVKLLVDAKIEKRFAEECANELAIKASKFCSGTLDLAATPE